MRVLFLAVGVILDITGAGLSFYPVFQDFDETGYEIPFHKSDDFPNQRDLFIMNVYSDCGLSDSVFAQFTIDDEPICMVAENWFFSLLIIIFLGVGLMIVGAILPSKTIESNLK